MHDTNAGGLQLAAVSVLDGSLTVTALGNLVAQSAVLLTDNGTNSISLQSTQGNIQVGLVQAGTYAASAAAAQAIRLTRFNGALRSVGYLADTDMDWTLTQAQNLAPALLATLTSEYTTFLEHQGETATVAAA